MHEYPDVYLDEPYTTTGAAHPTTSHDAARATLLRSGTARRRVLEVLVNDTPFGRCDEEIGELLGLSLNTVRPRRVELVRAGYVIDSQTCTTTRTGCRSILWVATPQGIAALEAGRRAATRWEQ